MNLNQLREEFRDREYIPYQDLLQTDEWRIKRREIIGRDDRKCTTCGESETMSHYDEKSKRTFHFHFEDEHWIASAAGEERLISVPKFVDKPYHLEVHHELYIYNRLPWEYESGDLITFCNWCHWDFHQKNQVPIYSEDRINLMKFGPCTRCNGAGWFPEYKNIEGGICFRCRGARYHQPLISRKL